jgi:hypothetical protein
MSTTDLTMAPSAASERSQAPGLRVGTTVPWARVALACALLAAAGGLRWWQEARVQAVLASGQVAPFPLKGLPMTLGDWQVPGGREEVLDEEVVRITGCVDYVKRAYVNQQTGVGVDLLVLYGPATVVHKPEVCYPGSGFEQVGNPREVTFRVPGGRADLLSLAFAKGEGGAADRQQVFYAIRHDGRWTDQIDFKKIARLPGVYKIQLSRRVGESERLDLLDMKVEGAKTNPCEAFLEAMLPELERRIAGSPTAPSP